MHWENSLVSSNAPEGQVMLKCGKGMSVYKMVLKQMHFSSKLDFGIQIERMKLHHIRLFQLAEHLFTMFQCCSWYSWLLVSSSLFQNPPKSIEWQMSSAFGINPSYAVVRAGQRHAILTPLWLCHAVKKLTANCVCPKGTRCPLMILWVLASGQWILARSKISWLTNRTACWRERRGMGWDNCEGTNVQRWCRTSALCPPNFSPCCVVGT